MRILHRAIQSISTTITSRCPTWEHKRKRAPEPSPGPDLASRRTHLSPDSVPARRVRGVRLDSTLAAPRAWPPNLIQSQLGCQPVMHSYSSHRTHVGCRRYKRGRQPEAPESKLFDRRKRAAFVEVPYKGPTPEHVAPASLPTAPISAARPSSLGTVCVCSISAQSTQRNRHHSPHGKLSSLRKQGQALGCFPSHNVGLAVLPPLVRNLPCGVPDPSVCLSPAYLVEERVRLGPVSGGPRSTS